MDVDDSKQLRFSPELGNVVFASAIDGWAFSIGDAAEYFGARLQMNPAALKKALWGEYYYNAKSKFVSKTPPKGAKEAKPMFVSMVLDNIWKVYADVLVEEHLQKMKNIISALDLKIPVRDLSTKDWRARLGAILGRWFPLSESVLSMIVGKLPGPDIAQKKRFDKIFQFDPDSSSLEMRNAILNCDSSESAPVLIYISKMIAMGVNKAKSSKVAYVRQEYVKGKFTGLSDIQDELSSKEAESKGAVTSKPEPVEQLSTVHDEKEKFIGFARIFSGQISSTSPKELVVFIPKHPPLRVTGWECVRFMGRDTLPLETAHAGNIFGIANLEDVIPRTATLSSDLKVCLPRSLSIQTHPIVKVAVSPKTVDANSLMKLSEGLRLLNLADPNVEIYVEDSGENVIVACGELHLERCLTDLAEEFAKGLKLRVSEPIVSYRETITTAPGSSRFWKTDEESKYSEVIDAKTANGRCMIRVRASPMPKDLIEILEDSEEILKTRNEEDGGLDKQYSRVLSIVASNLSVPSSSVWSFGPRRVGPNVLVNSVEALESIYSPQTSLTHQHVLDLRNSFVNGFQLATARGPLCDEPMRGVVFWIDEVILNSSDGESDPYGPFSGQLISMVKESCIQAFLRKSPRIVEAMFKVHLECSAEGLGKMFSLLEQRRGRVLRDGMRAGTDIFEIDAVMPVMESFGFSKEIRKRTKGAAHPQLVFSHWETLDIDPFWVPTTEQELEEFGDTSNVLNFARDLVNSIRKKKGLFVEEHLVERAEKQRTLKR